MAGSPEPGNTADLEARKRRLSVYSGEKSRLDEENQPPTGFQDPIEPVDETVESMAQAAKVAHQDDELEDDESDTASMLPSLASTTAVPGKKKKKKSRKPKSKRGIGAPTGFEEYFVEGPLTPAQHAQDLDLYDPALAFIDRILTATQNFEQSKRMESQRRDIFYKYLAYGGIDVGPNMFQGSIDTEGLDKSAITSALAQTSISSDKYNIGTPTAKFAVDFTACIRAFLSRRAMFYYGFETLSQVELVTSTLEKFMTYLLYHNVCPEYSTDIHSARSIAQKATTELYNIAQVQRWLPGDFNVAASTLYGGSYAQHYDGVSSWDPDDIDEGERSFIGFTRETAREIFGMAIATVGTEEQYQDYIAGPTQNGEFEVVEVKERTGLEVVEIVPVTEEHRNLYTTRTKNYRPVGIVHARPWLNKAAEGTLDLTAEERAEQEKAKSDPLTMASWQATETYTLFVEGSIMQFLFVGMKIEATLRKLRCGICFMDEFLQAFCSFDEWLCNELMVGWKEPRVKSGAVGWKGDGMGEEEEDAMVGGDEVKEISDAVKESIENGTAE